MNESFIFDLIILVGFIVFIFSRFFSAKLPKDDQKKRPQNMQGRQSQGKVVEMPRKPAVVAKPKKTVVSPEVLAKLEGAERLKAVDPAFNEKEFISGARQAFTLYWQAVAEGDEDTLDALAGPRVYDEALEQIEALAEDGKTLLTRIDKVKSIELVDTRVNGRTTIAEVKYTAEMAQAEVKKSTKSTTAKASNYEAVWVWARNIDDPDPNWELEDIKPLN